MLSALIISVVLFLILSMINKLFSLEAVYFSLWGISPWLYILFLAFVNKNVTFLKTITLLELVAGGIGIACMVDISYYHPDAQGGLAFIFIPLYQILFLVIATPLVIFFTKKQIAE
ncbi:hypothetical protein DBR00_17475 [Pseudomonas sp. HMWF032]|nr:hypothetical protein DBR00_17475 [Pseudomonas sp. HMWF032]PTT83023.1 hypothetical protein DBR41_11985 [Pseudomonas sp. HMWF010]